MNAAVSPSISANKAIFSLNRLIAAGIILLVFTARLSPGPRSVDDSFITFRYACNLLAGEGFVYNPGEHVLGTTTPLYTLLMAGLGALSGGTSAPFPWLALGVNTLADAATSILLWQIGRRLGSAAAGAAAGLVWAVAPFSVTFAIGGMETSLYIFLLTAVVYYYLRKEYTITAFLGALTLLTRPDAVLLLAPLALDRIFIAWKDRSSRIRIAELLALAIPLLAWGVFAVMFFGSPLPNSMAAKTLAYRLPIHAGLVRLLQHYATPFFDDLTFGSASIAVGLVLYPFLFLLGFRRAFRASPRAWAFFLYPWLYFAAFAISNVLIFRWYLSPPLPAYFLAIFLGAEEVLRLLFSKLSKHVTLVRSPGLQRVWTAVPVLILVLVPISLNLAAWRIHPDHGPDRPAPEMAWIRLEMLYQQAAEWITPELEPGDVIAAGDVGVLGFYTSAQILDTVGLISPQTISYYPLDERYYVINYAIPPRLILDSMPRYVVILEVYGRESLLKDVDFVQSYHLVREYSTDMYGSNGLLIFERSGPG